ncbi:hypothetical protein XM38_031400 [Halomicronema hongdechloris C2206]|uniref:Uncharacterized protein n=1 Tax=Halomicronema hongdechloris C2206 TaxID=1641165 RepID=A0A1Z3HPK3_9CYAN|nr:glycosyltransferase family 39 protein [Halomicronema hongdechloris]ASC72186.1 hypothetical protein XM38_031400 [Halomicronema hongdechloris C2206]
MSQYLGLIGVLVLGTVLRLWHLDTKPLWSDEVITALFSLGRSAADIPFDRFFSLDQLDQLFTLQPTSCAAIATALKTDSLHPPLFFCLMHHWLGWWQPSLAEMAYVLRLLPALFGVTTIAAIYLLGRLAFTPGIGLFSAALAAVSPFTVYLSQEARHYTLPMTGVALALSCLVVIHTRLAQGRFPHPGLWLAWVVINSLGFYLHYFFLLAVIAQGILLLALLLIYHRRLSPCHWIAASLALITLGLSYLPWLWTLLSHVDRPETSWLSTTYDSWGTALAPIYQTLASWMVMVVILPIEADSDGIVILSAVLMVLFAGWLAIHGYRGSKPLLKQPSWHPNTQLLLGFILLVLGQFGMIVYGLGKDITVAPRYAFVYYPAFCVLLGACLTVQDTGRSRQPIRALALVVGGISVSLTVTGWVFSKPYEPGAMAQIITTDPSQPVVLAVGYTEPLQQAALGLSYGLAIKAQSDFTQPVSLGLFSVNALWPRLSEQALPPPFPTNLWVISRQGMPNRKDPETLSLAATAANSVLCQRDPDRVGRLHYYYQRYRCSSRRQSS